MPTADDRPLLVQKLITSFFPTCISQPSLLSLSTEVDSLYYTEDSETSVSRYVSETPLSKQGNRDFYLGKCNAVSEESPRRALFRSGVSTDSCSYPNTSYDVLPSLSDVRFSICSPTRSEESVAFRR